MAKSNSYYILMAVLVIPAVTFVVLLFVAQAIVKWWELIIPVFLVYLFSFIASLVVRKACEKKTGNWRKALGWLALKTVMFTFGIVTSISYAITGGEPLFTLTPIHTTVNNIYMITLVVAWIIMACVNEVMIK